MGYRLPSHLLAPELAEPGRKPADLGLYEIDWEHWVGKHVKHAWLFTPSQRCNLVTNEQIVLGSNAAISTAAGDQGLYMNALSTETQLLADLQDLPQDEITLLIHYGKLSAVDQDASVILDSSGGSGNRCRVALPWQDGTIYWDCGNSSGNGRLSMDASSVAFGEDDIWLFDAGNAGMSFYQNGIRLADKAVSEMESTTGLTWDCGTDIGIIKSLFVLNKKFSRAVAEELCRNPYSHVLRHLGPGPYIPVDDSVIPFLPPKHYAPESFEPGKKPTREMEIIPDSPGAAMEQWIFPDAKLDLMQDGRPVTYSTVSPPDINVVTVGQNRATVPDVAASLRYVLGRNITVGSGNWTIFAHFQYDSATGQYHYVCGQYDTSIGLGICPKHAGSTCAIWYNNITSNTGVALVDGQVYVVVGTYDGVNMRTYLDGVLKDTSAASPGALSATSPFTLNNTGNVSSLASVCPVISAGYATRALSTGEVKAFSADLYASSLQPKAAPSRIVKKSDGFWLPDSRLEMPSLFEPGKKPTGETVINQDHWAGSRCIDILIASPKGFLCSAGILSNNTSTDFPSFEDGKTYFDGGGEHLNYGDIEELNGLSKFTVIAKVRLDDLTSDRVIVGKNATDFANGFTLFWDLAGGAGGDTDFDFYVGNTGTTGNFERASSNAHNAVGTYIVAATFDGSAAVGSRSSIYINGVDESNRSNLGTEPVDINGSGETLYIGRHNDGNRLWLGAVEYIIFFRGAFSAIEIAKLYNDPYQFLEPK